jgi:hypothetical protein
VTLSTLNPPIRKLSAKLLPFIPGIALNPQDNSRYKEISLRIAAVSGRIKNSAQQFSIS